MAVAVAVAAIGAPVLLPFGPSLSCRIGAKGCAVSKSLSRAAIYAAVLVLLAVTVLQLVRVGFSLPIGGRAFRPTVALVPAAIAVLSVVAISRLLRWQVAGLALTRFLLAGVGAATLIASAVRLLVGPGSFASKWSEYSGAEQMEIVAGSILAVACLALWAALESGGLSVVLETTPPPRIATKIALCVGGGVALGSLLLIGAHENSIGAVGQASCNATAARVKVSCERLVCETKMGNARAEAWRAAHGAANAAPGSTGGCSPEEFAEIEGREADARTTEAQAEKRLADALRGESTSRQFEIRRDMSERCKAEQLGPAHERCDSEIRALR